MRYFMKSGVLSLEDGKALMKMKGLFASPEKRVYKMDGGLVTKILIRKTEDANEASSDVRFHAYVMIDDAGNEIAVAQPDYAEGDDPVVVGWPICRMPRVDHASVNIGGKHYSLNMLNSQNYQLKDAMGCLVVQIIHRGLTGGWNIDTYANFAPSILCGLFAFCRYIEQENELLVV